jgi:histone H3/H4
MAVVKQDPLVVGSKVKALIKSKKCLTSGELLGALTAKVAEVLEKACERAKKNGRSTVRAHDL